MEITHNTWCNTIRGDSCWILICKAPINIQHCWFFLTGTFTAWLHLLFDGWLSGRTMAPPRLTGALRSFSTVSKQEDLSLELYDLKARHNLFSEQMFLFWLHSHCYRRLACVFECHLLVFRLFLYLHTDVCDHESKMFLYIRIIYISI